MLASVMLSLQLGVAADRPSTDRWLGTDKLEHFAASAAVQVTAYSAFRSMHLSKGRSLAAATATTLAVGLGKELLDRQRGYAISSKDLTWDFAGMSSMFGWLRRKDQRRRPRSSELIDDADRCDLRHARCRSVAAEWADRLLHDSEMRGIPHELSAHAAPHPEECDDDARRRQ